MRRFTEAQLGHAAIGGLALAVVLASMVLTPSDSAVALFGVELPPLCLFKRVTGMDCLGCGMTRSFTYMGHGELAEAFARHRLGPFLYAGVALQVPWRLFQVLRSGTTVTPRSARSTP